MEAIKLNWDSIFCVNPDKVQSQLKRMLDDHKDVFAEDLGTLKGTKVCGDYKCTINQISKLDNYPIPKTEDLLTTLGGCQKFTKLDMSQAYQQLLLEEESKEYTTINTHRGLYQYNRLPFGVSSPPGIFQRTMENLLHGIPCVIVRMDDILLGGR